MQKNSIHYNGHPSSWEWICLLLDVPEYWNRVSGIINDYQNGYKQLSNEVEYMVVTISETHYNNCVNISQKYRIVARFIGTPTLSGVVIGLLLGVLL